MGLADIDKTGGGGGPGNFRNQRHGEAASGPLVTLQAGPVKSGQL